VLVLSYAGVAEPVAARGKQEGRLEASSAGELAAQVMECLAEYQVHFFRLPQLCVLHELSHRGEMVEALQVSKHRPEVAVRG
jgi:hypothetical protein